MNILPIDHRRSPSPPLGSEDEKEETQSLVLHLSNSSARISTEIAVRETITEIFKGFSDAVYGGPRNINRWDEQYNFLRYDFPNLGLADYLKSVSNISIFYRGKGIGINYFERASYDGIPIGCFAEICLHKHREQSEDDYEDLLRKFPSERHALHTDAESDWGTCFSRKFNHVEYAEKSQARKRKQLDGMQKVVDTWDQTGQFYRVFAPSTEFRMKELKHLPEDVACTDIIILAYKSLPSVLRFGDNTTGPVLRVNSLTPELQQEARIRWDNMNRSLGRKGWDALPSFRSSAVSNRTANPDVSEEVSATELQPLNVLSESQAASQQDQEISSHLANQNNSEEVAATEPQAPILPNEPQDVPPPATESSPRFLFASIWRRASNF